MHREQGDLKPILFQLVQGVQDRMVLKGGRDDMALTLLFSDHRGGQESLIVRLAAAGGKQNLSRVGVDQTGDGFPRLFQRLFGLLADGIQAGRIAVVMAHTLCHHLDRRLAHAGRGGIIGIDLQPDHSFHELRLLYTN